MFLVGCTTTSEPTYTASEVINMIDKELESRNIPQQFKSENNSKSQNVSHGISHTQISQLQMGMSKQEVINILGNSYLVIKAINHEDGNFQEVLEYIVNDPLRGKYPYWVTFTKNHLTFYARGDYD